MKKIKIVYFFVMFLQLFKPSSELRIIPKIKLKPLVSTVTDIADQLVDFTLAEILNFDKFKTLFDKTYDTVDLENHALLNFLTNQRKIVAHNEKYTQGIVSFVRGLCEFSDLTADEMNEKVNKFVMPEIESEEDEEYENDEEEEEEEEDDNRRRKRSPQNKNTRNIRQDPSYLNYADEGYINPVLNQGLCGSCWSFSSVAAIEAACFKKTGRLLKLSEQQLIDCNRDDVNGNFGCSGGDMMTAFDHIKKNKGVTLASKYPYEFNDTFTCRKFTPVASVASYKHIEVGDEEKLKQYLIKFGPLAVAVDASLPSFQSYKSGIYYDARCTTNVNHAVLLVGYGTDKLKDNKKQDYWLIKNSYGTTWGLKGYIKLARNRNNHCGITEFAVVTKCA